MVDNLHLSALRTQSLPFRITEFVEYTILAIADRTLVKAIKDEAIRKKMPDRYINNIHSEYDGTYLWIWVDFKGKKGEPLDLFFEKGTKRHFIKPTRKKALKFKVQAAASQFKIKGEFLINAFSKGHWVRGIKARKVFEIGFEKGYPRFKRELQKDITKYVKETRLFG